MELHRNGIDTIRNETAKTSSDERCMTRHHAPLCAIMRQHIKEG